MVAYSFKPFFTPQIEALTKRQTVRSQRKRHARPGEQVQLFTGMRTSTCRKLVDPDPVCIRVRPISIVINISAEVDALITSISIEDIPLDRKEIEAFAIADGFGIDHLGDTLFKATGRRGSARANMGHFWAEEHGYGLFEGVLIEWGPA